MEMPASKKPKISLSEVHSLLQRQDELSGLEKGERSHEMSQDDEAEEDAQIQSSLPLYLNCIFGVGRRSTESCEHPDVSKSHSSQFPILDSQGFLFNTSDASSSVSTSFAVLNKSPCKQEDSVSPHLAVDKHSVSPVLFNSPETSRQSSHINIDQTTTLSSSPQSATSDQKPAVANPKNVRRSRKRKRSADHLAETYVCPPCCTKLMDCTRVEETVSIFVMVLQVHPVMDVACRTGTMAGRTVQMSSLLLADPTKAYFKLSLWREAAVWIERIAAGDILFLKTIKLKKWKKEIVGHTVMRSSVLNIHQPRKELPDKVAERIPAACVDAFLQWGRKYYGYLFESGSPTPKSQKPVKFVTSDDLGQHAMVHFRAKLLSVISSGVVLISDGPGKEIYLYLLSKEGMLWYNQLKDGVGQAWEFLYMAVTQEATQGSFALQTTSRSQLTILREGSKMAMDILKPFPTETEKSVSSVITEGQTLESVIFQKTSGIFELKASLASASFLLSNGSRLSVDDFPSLSCLEVVQRLYEAVYVGCESCSLQLQQDENDVYCQCMACMKENPGGYPSSTFYFRPLLITLCGTNCSAEITATYTVVPKILGTTPSDVVKANLSELAEKCECLSKAVLRNIQCVSKHASDENESCRWIVNCAVAKDDNSYLESLSLSLLDIKSY